MNFHRAAKHPTPQRAGQLLLVCCSAALALNNCRPQGQPQGFAGGVGTSRQAPSGELVNAPASSDGVHVAKSRSWHLSPDSPFTLVGEGLRTAGVATLDRTTIVYAAPCGSLMQPGSPACRVRPVLGDQFGPALPDAPGLAGHVLRGAEGAEWFGHWPADVWLRYGLGHEEFGPQHQFFNWDGGQWHTIATSPTPKGLEPYQIFDWYDGAKLVAQIQHWHYTVTYAVAPFLVWGQTSHPAPDFSQVTFPRDPGHELQLTSVQYAALPTHEVLVAHRLNSHDLQHTKITVAYAKRAGSVVVDPVLDAPGLSEVYLSSGRLGTREVIVAWGDLERNARHRSWFRMYDGESAITLPAPDPQFDKDGLLEVWLAGGHLWAKRGNPPVVWRLDGTHWSQFAWLRTGTQLTHVEQDGSLWGIYGQEVLRYDATGAEHAVPFLMGEKPPVFVASLVAATPDDIWLIAVGDGDESLVFRTKKMTTMWACE